VSYKGIWNWDAAFHAIAVSRWDRVLAEDQALIFVDSQKPDGMFVDVLLADGRIVDTHSKPPVFPWACEIVHRRTGDADFLRRAYKPLRKMVRFWEMRRAVEGTGLFRYGGRIPRFESGWDTSVRWDGWRRRMGRLMPVDLNCYMVMCYRALRHMAEVLGERTDAREYDEREQSLAEAVNHRLWDDGRGCYLDFDTDGRPSPVLTPASFMPMFAEIAPRRRALRMATLAADPRRLYPGMPTVSYDDPRYRSSLYWRGPAWLNTTWFAATGLRRYGHTSIAETLRETILDWCAASPDALYEYYDSRTGAGCGAPGFGWTSAFVIELILGW
jgi:neutral trehalase